MLSIGLAPAMAGRGRDEPGGGLCLLTDRS